VLSVPGHFDRKQSKGVFHQPDPKSGDYPVDRAELRRRIAPCLVHMLDAYFASLVIEQLAARGVRDFVSIHDGWLVPEYIRDLRRDGGWLRGMTVLDDCLAAAGREWLQGLGVVYGRLGHYLANDTSYGEAVRGWEARWRARLDAGRWPTFAAKTMEIQQLRPEWHPR
jgi:hypothetical protein